MITELNLSGYWNINEWPPSLNWTNHAPGIFSVSIMELADGNTRSFVPVITRVSWDISFNWSHGTFHEKISEIEADTLRNFALEINTKNIINQ